MVENNPMDQKKFRICAIAKDEGPYLADWIHHHLYFGFDQIHIYINRTTDNSILLLEEISKKYSQVTFECIDWLDYCDPQVSGKLQNIAYAKDLDYAVANNIDWWMCIDVDEYWIPKNFRTSIRDFVSRECFISIQPICFQWHCEVGKKEPFTFLENNEGYFIPPLVKTITPIKNKKISVIRVHVPVYEGNASPLDANGNMIEFDKTIDQHTTNAMRKPKKAYILHRMFRSEVEYTALLLRGRPSQPLGIKTNRPGYKPYNWDKITRRFDWPVEHFESYKLAREKFYHHIDVAGYIESDTKAIKVKSLRSLEVLKKLISKGDSEGIKVSNGLTIL